MDEETKALLSQLAKKLVPDEASPSPAQPTLPEPPLATSHLDQLRLLRASNRSAAAAYSQKHLKEIMAEDTARLEAAQPKKEPAPAGSMTARIEALEAAGQRNWAADLRNLHRAVLAREAAEIEASKKK